jgi:uncharacterized protein with HEPN domain
MSKPIDRLRTIQEKLQFIEEIIEQFDGKVATTILEDEKIYKPAIYMHFVAIAEQFNKLKNDNEFEILSKFKKEDLKGIYDIRTFIAHDYDNVNESIIENILRYHIEKMKIDVESAIEFLENR